MKRSIAVTVAILTTLISLGMAAQTHPKQNPKCERDRQIAGFQDIVKQNNGKLDTVHLNKGLAVIVVATESRAVDAIRAAARKYAAFEEAFKGDRAEAQSSECGKSVQLLSGGKATFETHEISGGVMFVYLTPDVDLAVALQDDCCKWCVCPAGTNTGCAHCC
jgi:hypothetical protein